MELELQTVSFKNPTSLVCDQDSSDTDMTIVTAGGHRRPAHKLIMARFSDMLRHVLLDTCDTEDTCLVLPEVEPGHLDLVLTLAYTGAVTSVTRHQVTAISDIFNLLSVKLDKFVVRAEEKQEIPAEDVVETEDMVEDCDDEDYTIPDNMEDSGNESPNMDDPCVESNSENDAIMTESNQVSKTFKFEHYEERDGLFYCKFPDCDYKEPFKTLGGCKNHQLRFHTEEEEKFFKCQFCDSKFASNQLRNKHQNLIHNKRYACSKCDKVFSEKTRLIIHSRIHSGIKPYKCDECSFKCNQKDNLRLHKEFKHPELGIQHKKFSCHICSASFLTNGNLKRHLSVHEDQKKFVCETCGKSFRDPGTLKQHTYSHGNQAFTCDICDQKFSSPHYLSRHILRLHPTDGIFPLKCGQCDKGFSLKHQLEEHIESVHENIKHRCPKCNLIVGRKSSVARHLKKGRCSALSSV